MAQCLPIISRIYINNQASIPARVIKCLGIEDVDYADVVIKYGNNVILLSNVKLLRPTRGGASRQFTIPREVREEYGILPLEFVEIISIKPRR